MGLCRFSRSDLAKESRDCQATSVVVGAKVSSPLNSNLRGLRTRTSIPILWRREHLRDSVDAWRIKMHASSSSYLQTFKLSMTRQNHQWFQNEAIGDDFVQRLAMFMLPTIYLYDDSPLPVKPIDIETTLITLSIDASTYAKKDTI